ncbi:septum formation family protein [Yinghuangia soli]|uniref:Septum formation family protein n=1 Tax=Yinghuangia soli TaxID=2908204 RepID=A0AA41U4F6_9ACTN|nr:septum formation family protein [Yinghuangia soli]MCF2530762.1 septum formation family protein [Yinghuangia soli]
MAAPAPVSVRPWWRRTPVVLGIATAAIAGVVVAVVVAMSGSSSGDELEDMRKVTAVPRFDAGDCFDFLRGPQGGPDMPRGKVPCDGPHDAEVVAILTPPTGDTYPGSAALGTLAREQCPARAAAYLGEGSPAAAKLSLRFYNPSEAAWLMDGDRNVTCFVTDPAGPMTGSLR